MISFDGVFVALIQSSVKNVDQLYMYANFTPKLTQRRMVYHNFGSFI